MATRAATLTDQSYWDDYWNRLSLPREYARHARAFYQNAILDVFDRHLPRNLGFLRRFNGPYLSGYAMAVYRLGTD
jgi:hypothetical protein